MARRTTRTRRKKLQSTRFLACRSAFSAANSSGAMIGFRCSSGGLSRPGFCCLGQGSPPREMRGNMSLAPKMLCGYRVLDFTQFVAGPTCTRLLAEAGAEVIKVELAPHGDRSRFQGLKRREHKQSSHRTYNFQHNHSKESLALDLKHPRGRELLRAMVPKVEVVVENFAPGV